MWVVLQMILIKLMTQLAFAMLVAIVIVYLVLVITFKGGLAPFTILFSLPFTIIGVVLALLITGENNICSKFNWNVNVNRYRSNQCYSVN